MTHNEARERLKQLAQEGEFCGEVFDLIDALQELPEGEPVGWRRWIKSLSLWYHTQSEDEVKECPQFDWQPFFTHPTPLVLTEAEELNLAINHNVSTTTVASFLEFFNYRLAERKESQSCDISS